MLSKNNPRAQNSLFGSIQSLPPHRLERLRGSWAEAFYQHVFVKIDEELFALLYAEVSSCPNAAVNVPDYLSAWAKRLPAPPQSTHFPCAACSTSRCAKVRSSAGL